KFLLCLAKCISRELELVVPLCQRGLGGGERATGSVELVLERRLAFVRLGAARLLVFLEAGQGIVTPCKLRLSLTESIARELELAFELPEALLALVLLGLELVERDTCVLELLLEL